MKQFGLLLCVLFCVTGLRGETTAGQNGAQRLTVELVDGSVLRGTAGPVEWQFSNPYGSLTLALGAFQSVTFSDADGGASCRMINDDELSGVLHFERLELDGLLGKIGLTRKSIRKISVAPRFHILGAEHMYWDVKTENVKSWQFVNENGVLSVTNIVAEQVNPAGGGTWSRVLLTAPLEQLQDFSLDADIQWTGSDSRVMQKLFIGLEDTRGQRVAVAGHTDAWSGHLGSRFCEIGEQTASSGKDQQPLSGEASLSIHRSDGRLQVVWDDVPMLESSSMLAASKLVIEFAHYASRSGQSTPGELTLQHLRFSGGEQAKAQP